MHGSPPGEEDKAHNLNETAESCQKSTMEMKGPGEDGNLCSRPGNVAPLAGFDMLRFKNNFLEVPSVIWM